MRDVTQWIPQRLKETQGKIMSQPIRRKHRITALLLSPLFLPLCLQHLSCLTPKSPLKDVTDRHWGGTRSSSVPPDKPKHPGGFLSWTKAAVTHRLRSTTVRLVDAVVLKLSGNAGHVKMFADTGDGSFPLCCRGTATHALKSVYSAHFVYTGRLFASFCSGIAKISWFYHSRSIL